MPDNRHIPDDKLYCHFVTFSCDGRRRLLDLDHPKQIVLDELTCQLRRQAAKCVGYVVMPNHVHAILWLPKTGELARFMHSWKRLSSYAIRDWYHKQSLQYHQRVDLGERFWIPKYYAFEIESTYKLEEKLTYMHLNPVRAGMVEKVTDWAWSSARWYEWREGTGVPVEWIEI